LAEGSQQPLSERAGDAPGSRTFAFGKIDCQLRRAREASLVTAEETVLHQALQCFYRYFGSRLGAGSDFLQQEPKGRARNCSRPRRGARSKRRNKSLFATLH